MTSPDEIIEIFTKINNNKDMAVFFQEILTPKEINDISLRWQLMKELNDGKTQRSIAAKHHISLCKITRGSKILKKETSLTHQLLKDEY